MSQVDGGMARDIAIFQGTMPAGVSTGFHAHPGDEHHIILSGRMRITQGDHVIEVGPGEYVLLDPEEIEKVKLESGAHDRVPTWRALGVDAAQRVSGRLLAGVLVRIDQ